MGMDVQPPQPRECQEKARLMDQYAGETSAFNRSVELLRSKLGTLPKAEYDQLQLLTEKTRLLCDAARMALYRHIRDHGC